MATEKFKKVDTFFENLKKIVQPDFLEANTQDYEISYNVYYVY